LGNCDHLPEIVVLSYIQDGEDYRLLSEAPFGTGPYDAWRGIDEGFNYMDLAEET